MPKKEPEMFDPDNPYNVKDLLKELNRDLSKLADMVSHISVVFRLVLQEIFKVMK